MNKKTISRKNNKGRIEFLSKEILTLTKEIPTHSVVGIIATAEIINEYLRCQWRRSESTQAKFRILNVLTTHNGRMKQTDISAKVFRSECTVTRVVDNLEKEGLVKREPDDDDRRVKMITITPKGIDFIEKTIEQRRVISHEIMSCLKEEEMVVLVNLLKQVRKNVRKFLLK